MGCITILTGTFIMTTDYSLRKLLTGLAKAALTD
jgi:hypothetical protein